MNVTAVTVHTELAEWWEIAVALTPLAGFLLTAAVIFISWCACKGSASTLDSWGRVEWALDMALDDSPHRRSLGLAALDQLSTDRYVQKVDAQIIAKARALLTEH